MSPSTRALEVLVVDGDPLALRALTRALQADETLRVVATALDTEQALAGAALEPDVAVVDAWMRGLGGPELIGRIHAIAPRTAILVLSPVEDDELALRVLRNGACGFLPKEVGADVLPRIVHAIARGEAVLTRALTARLVQHLREVPEPGPGLRPVRSPLSSREWEVLDLLVAGRGTRQIAEDLELAPETVRSHIKRILRKLGAHTRAEAIARARVLVTGQGREPEPALGVGHGGGTPDPDRP